MKKQDQVFNAKLEALNRVLKKAFFETFFYINRVLNKAFFETFLYINRVL